MTDSSQTPRLLAIAAAALLLVGLADGYYTHTLAKTEGSLQATVNAQGDAIQKLTESLDQARTSNADLEGQVASTKERLGAAQGDLRKAQQSSAQLAQQQKQWGSQLGRLQKDETQTQGTVGNLSTDVAGVKDGLNSTKEQVDSTRSDLQRVVGDLGVQSDLIARNHGEIDELRELGDRDYYEFDLSKGKEPERIGNNMAIGLRKTDMKKQRYTINLVSDDRTIEKKDKTANEPVQFYQAGFRQPSEIVVNQIFKNRIVGYISVPKKTGERTTLSNAGSEGPKPRG